MYCDYRLGPPGHWTSWKPKDLHLRLPDYVKDCVCFLCVEKDGVTLYGGTAFFTSLPSTNQPEIHFSYLVTAKHCVLAAYKKYGHLKIRVNRQEAKSDPAMIDVKQDVWVFPEDPGVDVAVMPVNVPANLLVYCMAMECFVGQPYAKDFGVGIGDQTTTVGLFTARSGRKANIPILRSGIISAMPQEELVDSKTAARFHAYLIEVRSIGGLSGSPVLVSIPAHRCAGRNEERPQDGISIPLGLIRSHWNVDAMAHDWDDFVRPEQINSGIAMVTPIEEVTKLIMENKKLKAGRDKIEKAMISGQLMVEDSAFDQSTETPFTKDDLVDALKKVSKKIEPKK